MENIFVTWQKPFSLRLIFPPHVLPWDKQPLWTHRCLCWQELGKNSTNQTSKQGLPFALTEGRAVARWLSCHRCSYRGRSSGGNYTGSPSWNWSSSLARWSWALPEAPLSARHSRDHPASCCLLPLLLSCHQAPSAWTPRGTVLTRTAGSRRPGELWSRAAAGCSPSTWRWWARASSRRKAGGVGPACGTWCSGCWRGRSSCRWCRGRRW